MEAEPQTFGAFRGMPAYINFHKEVTIIIIATCFLDNQKHIYSMCLYKSIYHVYHEIFRYLFGAIFYTLFIHVLCVVFSF